MTITTSPDISQLDVQVTWDISGSLPIISLVNLSEGDNLSAVVYAFVAKSPTGTFIHNGNIDSPDKSGIWSSATLTDAWPRPFNQIEWSGAPYSFYVIAKDSDGNVFTGDVQTATICRPAGNTPTSKNTFGLASSNVSVKCSEARIYFEDTTYHSYKGDEGEQVGSVLKVIYPIDETGTIPAPFQIASYTSALVPITYSSNNYQFWQYDIYDYDLGNNTLVRIKYQTIQTFAVWCNIDLEPLLCEYNKLINDVQTGNCSDVASANQKLALINSKMFLVFMGIMQPLTGVDVPSVIEEVKAIGGFNCDCCAAPTGIIPQTASVLDGYNFIINKVCGDINGTVTVNGTNITFNLQDKSYVFAIASGSPSDTTAFTTYRAVNGCQVTDYLQIDAPQLADDILNIISNNTSLINLFNSIVNSGGDGNVNLLVDGKCIFNTAAACDYTFDMFNVPASSTYAVLTSINGNVVNFAFNEGNLPALQAYLNTLGYGTFIVTNPNTNQVRLTANNNTYSISSVTYSVVGTSYIANMTKVCTGYTPISANQVVQNIINYLCDIKDSQIATAQDYEICYLDPITQTQKTVTVSSGAALTDLIVELLARGCDTINYIVGLSAATCDGIKALFPSSTAVLQANDYLLGTKEGACARISPVELGTQIFQYGIYNSTFMSMLCVALAQCGGGAMCAPFNYLYLTADYGSPSDDTMNIVVNFNHPAAIGFTLRYARIDNTNTPTYITVPNILPGQNPYQISGVADGQYFVGMTPIYSDGRLCSETSATTDACTGINSFSAAMGGSPASDFVISYSVVGGLPKIRVNISYPNGGSFSQIYTADGNDITITSPSSVYGDFYITITPVCNETTGFFGAASAPVILAINTAGIGALYRLGNDSGTVCTSGIPTTLYLSGSFAEGEILYTDVGLLTPISGYAFVVSGDIVYNLNTFSGAIGATTGLSCFASATIQNSTSNGNISSFGYIPGFPSQSVAAGNTAVGIHGSFTGVIHVGVMPGATLASTMRLYRNGTEVQFITIGAGISTVITFSSFTFTSADTLLILWS